MTSLIELTEFGALFLPLLVLIATLRREWLPAAIPVSAVLQAPAGLIVTIGGMRYGITPFNLVTAAAGLLLLFQIGRDPIRAMNCVRDPVSRPWAIYLAYATAGAMVLPHMFGGVLVHPLLAVGDVRTLTVPNDFSISHIAQAINHAGLLVLLVYLVVQKEPARVVQMMAWGFVFAFAISLAAAIYQRAVFLGWYSTDFSFWASNPSYNQWFHAPEYGPTFGRVGLPFIEPSYASVWFAGVVGGCGMLATYARGRVGLLAVLVSGLAALALFNTVGTSGIVSLALFLLLVLLVHVLSPTIRTRRSKRVLVALVGLVALGVSMAALDYMLLKTEAGAPLRSAIWFTSQKASNVTERPRFITTLHAILVFVESYGIGIGPGSTRTSGFLVSLLAHLGVPGLLLMMHAMMRTLWELSLSWLEPRRLFALGMITAGGLGVLVGIADLAWPVVWGWILFAMMVARLPRVAGPALPRDILSGPTSA